MSEISRTLVVCVCTHIPAGAVVGVEVQEDLLGVPVKQGGQVHAQVKQQGGMVTLHMAEVPGLPPAESSRSTAAHTSHTCSIERRLLDAQDARMW